MSFDSLIILPIAIGFGLLYWSSLIDENHPILKLMLQFMFFPLIFLSIQLSVVSATLLYSADSTLVTNLSEFAYYTGWLMYAVGVYYMFAILKTLWDMFQTKKQQKDSETYEGDL